MPRSEWTPERHAEARARCEAPHSALCANSPGGCHCSKNTRAARLLPDALDEIERLEADNGKLRALLARWSAWDPDCLCRDAQGSLTPPTLAALEDSDAKR